MKYSRTGIMPKDVDRHEEDQRFFYAEETMFQLKIDDVLTDIKKYRLRQIVDLKKIKAEYKRRCMDDFSKIFDFYYDKVIPNFLTEPKKKEKKK